MDVFPDVLLGHECDCGDSIIAAFKHSLHSSNISYFGGRTVLDECIGVTLDIDIEYRNEDHDGSGYVSAVTVRDFAF